jgi:hypothetical protein
MLCREEGEGSGGACAVPPAAAGQFVHVGPTVRKKEERAKLTGMATFFPFRNWNVLNIVKERDFVHRDGIVKLSRSPGIYCNESIPPAYVAWRAGTTTL